MLAEDQQHAAWFATSRLPVWGMHPIGSPVARPSLPVAIRMRESHGDFILKGSHVPDKDTSHPQSSAALQACTSSRGSSKQRVSGRLSLGTSSHMGCSHQLQHLALAATRGRAGSGDNPCPPRGRQHK